MGTSHQAFIERCEAQLRALIAKPGYDKARACLWAELILSAKKGQPMKHVQDETPTVADSDISGLFKAIDYLKDDYENLDYRQVLINNLEKIEEAKEDLLNVLDKIHKARERQESKLVYLSDYSMAAE